MVKRKEEDITISRDSDRINPYIEEARLPVRRKEVVAVGYELILGHIEDLARRQDDIECAFYFGSRAHATSYADGWSDLDVALITTSPDTYTKDTYWLAPMGKPLVAFNEAVSLGHGMQTRVLFAEDFSDVDFGFFTPNDFKNLINDPRFFNGVLGRGIVPIVDKTGLLTNLPLEEQKLNYTLPPLTQESLAQHVDDILYHAVNAVKKLHKGEILTAKDTLDSSIKNTLMTMIRWHIISADPSVDTWHRNRHFEKWVDESVMLYMPQLYAVYDRDDIYSKIIVNIDFLKYLVESICSRNQIDYPPEKLSKVTDWVKQNGFK